jgi:hypothetical protein
MTVDPNSVTVAADGTVTNANVIGPVTKESVQAATALAAELDAKGFPIAEKTLRDLANLASKRIPAPTPDQQIPLPVQCFTPDQQTQLTKTLQVERDPQKLQQIIDALEASLKAAPAECRQQIQNAIDSVAAIMAQAIAQAAADAAILQTQQVLTGENSPTVPPFVPGVPTTPPNPTTPANVRVTVVQKGDGFATITKRLLGSDSRWTELRDANVPNDADGRSRQKDTTANGGIKPILQPGQKLFVPASWPSLPSVTIPAPLPAPVPQPAIPPTPAAPVTPAAPAAGVGPAVVTVRKGEGPSQVAARLLGASQGAAKWKELRNRNVPVDAGGVSRSVDSASGNFKPGLNPGDRLFVPETWPIPAGQVISGAAFADLHNQVAPKSDAEIAAESLCEHLLRAQVKSPDDRAASRLDKKKVARFRMRAGLGVSPNVTPEVLLSCAEHGVSRLPLVVHAHLGGDGMGIEEYCARLMALAKESVESGDLERAAELRASAEREAVASS